MNRLSFRPYRTHGKIGKPGAAVGPSGSLRIMVGRTSNRKEVTYSSYEDDMTGALRIFPYKVK